MNTSDVIPLITFDNVRVRLSGRIVLDKINLKINEGEHWAILGESGSGKTSLLKTIAGKAHAFEGNLHRHFYAYFCKRNNIKSPTFSYQELVAVVSNKHTFRTLSHTKDFYYQQRFNSYDSEEVLTVQEYLNAIEAKENTPDSSWTYAETIRIFNLEGLTQQQLIKLSNGETKRLLLAAALLQSPKILLLDDPLIGLDVQTRNNFSNILKLIAARGVSVIMTTAFTEIPEAITHVAKLEKGKIVKSTLRENYIPIGNFGAQPKVLNESMLQALQKKPIVTNHKFIVKMKDVTVRYGAKLILKDINWTIKKGERWALSGPNGSGKSTLLSLINGDNPLAYANDLVLFDRKRGSGESIWDIKAKIGFMSPELHQFFPGDQTCLKVIESGFYDTQGLFRKSHPEKKNQALQWMHLFSLEKEQDKRFNSVSNSTQRLCLLARALIKNPPLLILDEPCQGLDKRQQINFRHIIDTICQFNNTTLIYVTHYSEELPDCIQYEKKLQ